LAWKTRICFSIMIWMNCSQAAKVPN